MNHTGLVRAVPVRTFEAVVGQLRSAILGGTFEPGDRLPSQRQLAEDFGCSRNTVAQAIRILERSGLITIRPGATGGAFVATAQGAQLGSAFELLMESKTYPLQEVLEFRHLIEGQNALWAAERRNDQQLQEMASIVSRIRELDQELAGGGDAARIWPMLLTLDALFHRAISEASHNGPSRDLLNGILPALHRILEVVPTESSHKIYTDAVEVYDAIKRKDSIKARMALQKHIHSFGEITTRVASRGADISE